MHAFDAATAARARSGDAAYDVVIDEAWTIGPDRPNGGYLLATMGRAAVEAASAAGAAHPHPLAANVDFVTPPGVGPAVVETEVLRTGRTASQVRARLVQDGRPCAEARFTLGTLTGGSTPFWGGLPPAEMPSEDDCLPILGPNVAREGAPPLRRSVVERFDPVTVGFFDGAPSGLGELRAWFRFADGREPDPLSLLFVVDGLMPATFDVVATGWVPTLSLTVYVRAVPAPGPLRVRMRAQLIQDGFADEVCEVWDSEDRLVAQSTQLAALRLPG